ncbi:hypothetical protein ACHAWO_003726 [Cyclotella atomus]|uniref:Uncharacterized protein n=1 Tax=Cyclotella atomus TaxID=382360 RepID=A0ABD3P370_9STRA
MQFSHVKSIAEVSKTGSRIGGQSIIPLDSDFRVHHLRSASNGRKTTAKEGSSHVRYSAAISHSNKPF